MYRIYRNNRVFSKTLFVTYEEARQCVRRWIRKNLGVDGYNELAEASEAMHYDDVSRNPTCHGICGFKIKRV